MDGRYHFLWLHITRQAYTLTHRLGIKGAVLRPLRSENLNVANYSQVRTRMSLLYIVHILNSLLYDYIYDCYKISHN